MLIPITLRERFIRVVKEQVEELEEAARTLKKQEETYADSFAFSPAVMNSLSIIVPFGEGQWILISFYW